MKNKLLTFIAVLVASVTSYNVQAQDAPIESGATITDGGVYVMYNLGSRKFLNNGNSWGSRATASGLPARQVRLDASEDSYIITSVAGSLYSNNTVFMDAGAGIYLDGAATQANRFWELTQVSTGVYTARNTNSATGVFFSPQSIQADGLIYSDSDPVTYADFINWVFIPADQAELLAAKLYLYEALIQLSESTAKTAALTVYNNTSATKADYYEALSNLASESNPVDLSLWIENPGFEGNRGNKNASINYWTNENNYFLTQDNSSFSLKTGTYYCEKWIEPGSSLSNATLTQTLTEIPNGRYTVTVAAGFGGNGLFVTANNDKTEITNDNNADFSVTTSVVNNTLILGMQLLEATSNYARFDNFRLTYLGFDPAAMIATIDEFILEANNYIATNKIHTTVQSALTTSISNAGTAKTTATKAALETAAADLIAKIDAAKISIQEYELIAGWITDTEALYTLGYLGLADFQTAINTIQATLTNQNFEKVEANAAVKNAVKTYVLSQTGASTINPLDFTLLIENNSFETGDLTGWTVNGDSQDTGVKPNSNATYTINNADGNYIFNTWSYGYGISQSFTDMPNGVYEISVLIAQDAEGQVTIFANDETTLHTHAGDKATGETCTVSVTVNDGTLTLGTKDGNNWYKVDNFQLSYKGEDIDALKAFLKTQLDPANALKDQLNDIYVSGASTNATITAFKSSVTAAQDVYDTSVNTEEITSTTEKLKTQISTINSYLVNDYSVTVAFAVKNNDFSDGLNNWTITDDAVTIRSNEHYSNTTNSYFDSDNSDASAWSVTGTQTVIGLEEGLYYLSFASRASANATVSVTASSNLETKAIPTLSVGNQGGELGRGWNPYSTFVTVDTSGKLEIAINASAAQTQQWMSIDDFTLRKVGVFAMVKDGNSLLVSGEFNEKTISSFRSKVIESGITSADLSYSTGSTDFQVSFSENPNLIFYGLDNQFIGIDIINENSNSPVILSEQYAFHAPKDFNSNISFSRSTFADKVNHKEEGGWQTICLPFDVDMDAITCDDEGGNLVPITEFEGESSGLRPFWLYRADEKGLVAATEIKANVPYLILIPNDADPENGYTEYYNISGILTFKGTKVVATDLKAENAKTYFLNGCFSPIAADEDNTVYGLNAAGSNFVAGTAMKSFTAYANNPTNSNARVIPLLGEGQGDITSLPDGITLDSNKNLLVYTSGNGIVNVLSTKAAKVSVYTIDGQLFGAYDLTEGVNAIQLPANANGNKYVINSNVVIVY